jgi:hypothetical protein
MEKDIPTGKIKKIVVRPFLLPRVLGDNQHSREGRGKCVTFVAIKLVDRVASSLIVFFASSKSKRPVYQGW